MSGRCFVLDTSALPAWLEGEDGVERVRELLRGGRLITADLLQL